MCMCAHWSGMSTGPGVTWIVNASSMIKNVHGPNIEALNIEVGITSQDDLWPHGGAIAGHVEML